MWIEIRATGQRIDMVDSAAELYITQGKAVAITPPKSVAEQPRQWPGPSPLPQLGWRLVISDTQELPILKCGPCPACNQIFQTSIDLASPVRSLKLEHFDFPHCGKVERPPIDLFERFARILKDKINNSTRTALSPVDIDPSPSVPVNPWQRPAIPQL